MKRYTSKHGIAWAAAPLCVAMVFLASCADEGAPPDVDIRLSQMEGSRTMTAALSVTDANGEPLELDASNTSVVVETRETNGTWQSASDVDVRFGGPSRIDVMVVADNSGSLEQDLVEMQDALRGFTHLMLAGSQHDRVGLVRVSTEASIHQPLTVEPSEIYTSIDDMFINRGWTALYDGIRVAHEQLDGASVVATDRGNHYCVDGSYLAAVVFTDGKENNSADQNDTIYAGDGIDTTLSDLLQTKVRGVTIPIYTVGIGDDTDPFVLDTLALSTGGEYRHIDRYRQLKGALESAAAGMKRSIPVCFDPAACGDDEARIDVTVSGDDGGSVTQSFELDLPDGNCP